MLRKLERNAIDKYIPKIMMAVKKFSKKLIKVNFRTRFLVC